jgi:hypothetical protein
MLSAPVFIATAGVEYPFQNGNSFEISRVDDLNSYFAPNVLVEISVKYRTRGSRVDCTPENGFHLQAYITDPDVPEHSIGGFNGKYDDSRDEWYFELKVPSEVKKNYELEIALYCGSDEALCAEEYGRAARTSEAYYFEVWEK